MKPRGGSQLGVEASAEALEGPVDRSPLEALLKPCPALALLFPLTFPAVCQVCRNKFHMFS